MHIAIHRPSKTPRESPAQLLSRKPGVCLSQGYDTLTIDPRSRSNRLYLGLGLIVSCFPFISVPSTVLLVKKSTVFQFDSSQNLQSTPVH